jgi:hypothetical protein
VAAADVVEDVVVGIDIQDDTRDKALRAATREKGSLSRAATSF